mgnify:CR=1 FL=1
MEAILVIGCTNSAEQLKEVFPRKSFEYLFPCGSPLLMFGIDKEPFYKRVQLGVQQ